MILITLNTGNFEYDIHSLVKAFFPEQEVNVTAEARVSHEEPLLSMHIAYEPRGGNFREGVPDAISFSIHGEHRKRIFVNDKDRIQAKNALKRALYQLLSEYTNTTLPWGTLTGIRPTKIPMAHLEEGRAPEWIKESMKETYLASDEKIDLSIRIAEREMRLLKNIDYEQGYSLYIGIPFCPSTCLYCSFTSYPLGKWTSRMDEYLDALEKEIDAAAEQCRDQKLNTIYIGGGTPTTLTASQLDRLLAKIGETFDFRWLVEYTVEAGRPDSIALEKLITLRKHSVSRISINPQTMKQETLQLIGRHHTVEQTIESYAMARKLGFDNINMDLIVGLPQETLEDVKNTMEQVQRLNPDSITIHSLALKRAARLRMFQEEYEGLQIRNTKEIMELTERYATEAGLHPYYLYRQKNMAGNFENVGYAKEGKEGLYNILIMEEKQTIVACGAGTITKRVYPDGRIERCDNVKDVALYIEKIDEMIERKQRFFSE